MFPQDSGNVCGIYAGLFALRFKPTSLSIPGKQRSFSTCTDRAVHVVRRFISANKEVHGPGEEINFGSLEW